MKIKKNGFTFVELIAVITIIGVLSLIAIPTVEKIIKDNKDKIYQTQLDNIVLSLKNWASDNKEYLPEKENDSLTITLGQLKANGYIEYDLKNPKNNKCFDNNMLLKITKIKQNYDYNIDTNSITESDECEIDMDKPMIILNGNVIEKVEVNSTYIDSGVIAKDKNGVDITSKVSKTITGNGNSVDTTRLNSEYIITYMVSDNGKTTTISRTVKIVDTTPPVIIIPGNVAIDTSATSFDVMNGVSASDNSKETIKIQVKSNISFGIPGRYTITYTAIDSSGNKAEQKRVVTIKD